MQDLLQSNFDHSLHEAIRQHTSAFRNFNTAAVSLFLLCSVFLFIFFGNLETAQLIFYFLFFLTFAVANIVFLTAKPDLQKAWVLRRRLTLYVPLGIVIVIHLVSMVITLGVLDGFNEKINNAFPVPEKDATLASVYVVMMFALYIMPSLFQSVSFLAYVEELALYHENPMIEAESPKE